MNIRKPFIQCQFNQISPTSVAHHSRRRPLGVCITIPAVNITAHFTRHKYRMPTALKQRFDEGLKVTSNNLLGIGRFSSHWMSHFSAMQTNKILHNKFFAVVLFKKPAQYFYVGVLST